MEHLVFWAAVSDYETFRPALRVGATTVTFVTDFSETVFVQYFAR